MPKLPRIWRPPGETLPRGKWGVTADFPLAALAFVWSFKTFTFMPLATASTGPLIIASVVLLLAVGIPLLFIETGIGQMTGYGSAMALRRMCPLLGGTGFVVILHAVIICMQYSIFGAWSLYYGFALIREAMSLAAPAMYDTLTGEPVTSNSASSDWKLLHCNNEYNTDLCVKIGDWNACNITWFEDKLEEALQEDTPSENAQTIINGSLSGGITYDTTTTTITPLLTALLTLAQSGVAAADASQSGSNSLARRRHVDSTIFRKDYEDNRHCVASSEEYFTHYVLHIGASLGDIGAPAGHLLPCILIVWILAFFGACKGARSLAKMAWIVVIASTFVLIAITLGTWSLLDLTVDDDSSSHQSSLLSSVAEDSTKSSAKWGDFSDGIITGEKRHTSLFDISVWMQAAEFVLITILFGTGNLTTLASYNRRRNNLVRDVFIIAFGHLAICLLVNANMTMWLQYVIDTARRRAGLQIDFHEWRDWTLLFIVSPLVIKRQAHALLWTLLFYLMTFLVALSTLYTALETLANFVQDEFLEHFRNRTGRVTGMVCAVGFVLSLFFTTRAGVFWLKLINHFINGTSLIIMLLIVVLVFVFGIERFKNGMRRSIYGHELERGGHRLTPDDKRGSWFLTYFHYGCYASVVVIILTLLWILIINSPPLQYYGSGKPYPLWAHIACLMMALGCLSPIVIYPIYCGAKLWPELRAEQQQLTVAAFLAGKEGRLSGNMRRADSEILRRLQRSSTPSLSRLNGGSNVSPSGSVRFQMASASNLNNNSNTVQEAVPLKNLNQSQSDETLTNTENPENLPSSRAKNHTEVKFFSRTDSEDGPLSNSTSAVEIDDAQNAVTTETNLLANNSRKHVQFSATPKLSMSSDRQSGSPTSDKALGDVKSARASGTFTKLLSALITPHSFKLSIVDTDEDEDNVDDVEAQPGYDDIFSKKKEFDKNVALRLSSARDDDDDDIPQDTSLHFLNIPMPARRPSSVNSITGGGRKFPADSLGINKL